MREIEFVALDCETTGLDCTRDSIIELGAVKFSLTENLVSFDSLFSSPTRIPQFVERLTGIQNSDLKGAPKFQEKCEEFRKFCEGKILLGHNISFDLGFLASAGLDLRQNPSLDTFELARLVLPRGESLSLENLAQKFKVKHEDAHRALADAEATRDLLRILIALAKNFSSEKWQKIVNLNAEKTWVQNFASLVLESGGEIQKLDFPKAKEEVREVRSGLVEKLQEKFTNSEKSTLLEVVATSAEIVVAAEKVEKPVVIFFAEDFEVRKLSAEKIFSSRVSIDSEKLEQLLSRNLSVAEASLAAKLILHSEKTLPELSLSRAENLLFDFVAREGELKDSDSQVLVSTHSMFSEFREFDRLKIIASAISFPESLARESSLTLDLPTLEELLPQHSEKIQLWWGMLGLLFREAAPKFGRLNLVEASGLKSFSAMLEAGKNLLATAQENLPPKVFTALENFLSGSPDFYRSVRSNFANEITLEIAPLETSLPDLAGSILLDAAMDAGDDFSFANRIFKLDDSAVEKVPSANNFPRFLVANDFPDAASPQFFPAVEKFLLKELPKLAGITAVVFPNRMEAGNFTERGMAELDCPVFFRKLPSMDELTAFDRAVIILTTGSKFLTSGVNNFVSVKLPFIVRDGADWQTETLPDTILRFKKMWANFADSEKAEKFIALDSRLLTKKYGGDFLRAIPARFEKISVN